ncbi:MAG: flagellar export chaperone FliS [Moorellales bacterium]
MYAQQAYQAYQENQVQTQPQEKLVLMLYEGALRFIKQAQEAVAAKKYDQTSYFLGRAQDILSELMLTLNLEVGEIAHRLYALYDFMYRHLVQANLRKDPQMMAEVYRLLSELRDTWEEATRRHHSHNYLTRPGGLEGHS